MHSLWGWASAFSISADSLNIFGWFLYTYSIVVVLSPKSRRFWRLFYAKLLLLLGSEVIVPNTYAYMNINMYQYIKLLVNCQSIFRKCKPEWAEAWIRLTFSLSLDSGDIPEDVSNKIVDFN